MNPILLFIQFYALSNHVIFFSTTVLEILQKELISTTVTKIEFLSIFASDRFLEWHNSHMQTLNQMIFIPKFI